MQILQIFLRNLILAGLTWLCSRGLLTQDVITDANVAGVVNLALPVFATLGAIAWSWIQHERAKLSGVPPYAGSPGGGAGVAANTPSAPTPSGNKGYARPALLILLGACVLGCLMACAQIGQQPTASTDKTQPASPVYSEIVNGFKTGASEALAAYKTPAGQTLVHGGLIGLGNWLIIECVPEADQPQIRALMSGYGGDIVKLETGQKLQASDFTAIFTNFYPTTGEARAQEYNQTIGAISQTIESIVPGINALGTAGWINASLQMLADVAWKIGDPSYQSDWKPYSGN